jgi:hydroxymethylpyrimidine/phosphomethylpyrimidine kinase
MKKREKWPVALTIAGSDSGGGAGIEADLKTFGALGVHGTCAITCVTAQNPNRVRAIEPCSPSLVRKQIEAVLEAFPVRAVKTGMLFSKRIIEEVAKIFREKRGLFFVVDPVMVATSGARLLQPEALGAVRSLLAARGALVTPNLDEARILAGCPLDRVEDLRTGARAIHARWGCAVLAKGGHLSGANEAVDIFYDGRTELLLKAPFIQGVSTHGTGCTYSAAVAGYLALGCDLPQAVPLAKEFITQAIAQSVRVGNHTALNPFWA